MGIKQKISILLTLVFVLVAVGCGGSNSVTNKEMSLDFSFGTRSGTYTGEVNEQGIPNGKGKFNTKNDSGTEYYHEGQWKDGHWEGQGVSVWPDINKKLEGNFSNDLLNGKGKLYENGKLRYEGEFVNDIMQGQGKLYDNNGNVEFEGLFDSGFPSKPPVGLNNEVIYASWRYSVTGVSVEPAIGNKQAKGKFVEITINAFNQGKSEMQFNQFLCLYDDQGRVFKMDNDALLQHRLNVAKNQGDWYLSQIGAGSSGSFVIIFDVPVGAKNLKLMPDNKEAAGKVAPIIVKEDAVQ